MRITPPGRAVEVCQDAADFAGGTGPSPLYTLSGTTNGARYGRVRSSPARAVFEELAHVRVCVDLDILVPEPLHFEVEVGAIDVAHRHEADPRRFQPVADVLFPLSADLDARTDADDRDPDFVVGRANGRARTPPGVSDTAAPAAIDDFRNSLRVAFIRFLSWKAGRTRDDVCKWPSGWASLDEPRPPRPDSLEGARVAGPARRARDPVAKLRASPLETVVRAATAGGCAVPEEGVVFGVGRRDHEQGGANEREDDPLESRQARRVQMLDELHRHRHLVADEPGVGIRGHRQNQAGRPSSCGRVPWQAKPAAGCCQRLGGTVHTEDAPETAIRCQSLQQESGPTPEVDDGSQSGGFDHVENGLQPLLVKADGPWGLHETSGDLGRSRRRGRGPFERRGEKEAALLDGTPQRGPGILDAHDIDLAPQECPQPQRQALAPLCCKAFDGEVDVGASVGGVPAGKGAEEPDPEGASPIEKRRRLIRLRETALSQDRGYGGHGALHFVGLT